MRKLVWVLAGLSVAACDPGVPNSAAGVGFGDYTEYALRREAELRGMTPNQTVAPTQPAQPILPPTSPQTLAPGAPLSAIEPQPATAAQGSIGADALAALRATAPAQTAPSVAPRAAPAQATQVNGSAGPNLAAYALSVSHQPGQSVYPRGGIALTSTEKACAKYVSPDLAQMAFLEAGGPQKDRKNLDPDGDGFVCGWDPRPFRAALQ